VNKMQSVVRLLRRGKVCGVEGSGEPWTWGC